MANRMRTPTLNDRLCSVQAAEALQDPIGLGSPITRMLAIEVPTPWGDGFYDADPAGTILQRISAIQAGYFERLRTLPGGDQVFSVGYQTLYGIAPDREWSVPELRRVLLVARPEGPFSQFEIAEYHFPFDSERVVDFVRVFFEAPEDLSEFGEFRVEHGGQREFFVCTHGQVDICCAKFGVPLYMQARRAYPQVRAWRMSHFGGHRFAPTAWEFPSGYKWAFLDEYTTERVLQRDGHPADLSMRLRGWSGVPNRVQILDRVGLQRFGWDWLDFVRSGQVLEADEEAKRWRVRLDFESPSGECGTYEGVVVVGREIHESGCGPHFGEYDFEIAEYRLESLIEI